MELESPPEDPEGLPGRLEGAMLRIETEEPLQTVAELGRKGLAFHRLKVFRSDLETVFLNLTGRRLRDE